MNKKKIIYGQICLILIAAYPVLSLYISNINELRFNETLLPIFINVIVSEIILFITCIITRQYIPSIVYTTILFYIGIYFKEYFADLIDKIFYWNAVPVVLYVTIIILILINHTKIRLILDKVLLFITIGVVFSTVLTFFNNIDKVRPNENNEAVENGTDNSISQTNKRQDLPNIYFLILDEYSSFNQIKKWYDYDNKVFYDFLKEHNFNIIMNSQNESMNTLTMSITTNYINLNYVVQNDNDFFGAQQKRSNPYLFRLLDEYGYKIEYYGGPPIKWKNEVEVKTQSTTVSGEKFIDIIYKNNIFYPFVKQNKMTYATDELNNWNRFINTNNGLNNNFVFFHSNGAHIPYVFDENGNSVSFSKSRDLKDKLLYVNQYIYITRLSMEFVEKKIKEDPECIIIIMSDHSMRNLEDSSSKRIIPAKDFQQVFNAVYFQGKHLDLSDNLSGVNTLRFVLDAILNTNMGVVNVP